MSGAVSEHERNKEIVRRETEGLLTGDIRILREVISPDYVSHDIPIPGTGPEALLESTAMWRNAFTDLNINIDMQIAEGDRVASRWTACGRHTAPFGGIPASGRSIQVTGTSIERIVDGLVTDTWEHIDMTGLLEQIGAWSLEGPTAETKSVA